MFQTQDTLLQKHVSMSVVGITQEPLVWFDLNAAAGIKIEAGVRVLYKSNLIVGCDTKIGYQTKMNNFVEDCK